MMQRLVYILLSLTIIQNIHAQINVFETERKMAIIFDTIFNMNESHERDSLNQELISSFSEILLSPEALYYSWKGLSKIGNLLSEDKRMRVFTWHLPGNNDQYTYYGFIQFNQGKNKAGKEDILIIPLSDNSAILKNAETLSLSPENWYGSVYYKIKMFSHRRDDYYVLMGYDFNNNYSQKKILEVLWFDNNGEARFEGNFDMEFQPFKRVIFEYSDRVAMTLNYDDRLDMIVFDHLAPFEPIFTGNYLFYGPDGSYDGFRFEKSVFHFEKDIDARNQ